jgi:dihydropyrimidine dehydrogenase (NAD+) subunit PreA
VEDMIDGLRNWMAEKGFSSLEDFRGLSLGQTTEWKHLDLNYKIVARISETKCIGCSLCYIACWDGAHQCIHLDRATDGSRIQSTPAMIEAASRQSIATTPIPKLDSIRSNEETSGTPLARIPRVDEQECVGCNLCNLVCPVDGCITMEEVSTGLPYESWQQRAESETTSEKSV